MEGEMIPCWLCARFAEDRSIRFWWLSGWRRSMAFMVRRVMLSCLSISLEGNEY